MKTYYVGFSNFGKNKDNLLSDYLIITGKTGTQALQKYYGKKFKRDADRCCDVIMTECRVENGKPILIGRQCGYSEILKNI